jgi:hypothetical protein
MRNMVFVFMMTVLLFTSIPLAASATEPRAKGPDPEPTEIPVEVQEMLDRIEEIKEMDRSALSRAEKKELRKELREMKKEVRAKGYGIYLSAGAIILILLLIILL